MAAPVYVVSYDNPRSGDYQRPIREMGKVAHISRLAPKTTLRLERRRGARFADVKAAAARSIHPTKGSAILFSQRTSRFYVLDNRGNRRGVWVRH